jgi:hypothetical protein
VKWPKAPAGATRLNWVGLSPAAFYTSQSGCSCRLIWMAAAPRSNFTVCGVDSNRTRSKRRMRLPGSEKRCGQAHGPNRTNAISRRLLLEQGRVDLDNKVTFVTLRHHLAAIHLILGG